MPFDRSMIIAHSGPEPALPKIIRCPQRVAQTDAPNYEVVVTMPVKDQTIRENGHVYPVEIVGRRLTLREYRIDDAEVFHSLLTHPRRVLGPLEVPDPTIDMVVTELTRLQAAAQEPDRQEYMLAVTFDGQLIGSCSLSNFEPHHYRAELGYTIHPDLHGNGYASEAARLMVHLGIGELGLHRIEATTAPDNAASRGVLEKIGMSYEGLAREYVLVGGHTWRDSLRYAILATDPTP